MGIQVRTSAGIVSGRWENGIAVFRGIPFAAPPVGANRFATPRPVVQWDGIRDATRFGPPPPQPRRPTAGDEWLNLAVWTSGGTYLNCDTANPHFAGATLAREGVVVVSANYRTGAEGFSRIDGVPDNRGLLDQIAALRWVHNNIAKFGGDPSNITVLGQSAGAGSIAALLVMPAAAGMFRRAILQSLPGTYVTPELAADIASEINAELGRSPNVDDLAGVEPDELVKVAESVTDRLMHYQDRWGAMVHTGSPFAPIVDGEILPVAPCMALAGGAARDIDLLVGNTRDEFSLAAARLGDTDNTEVDALLNMLTPTPGVQRYRQAYPPASPSELRNIALSDWLFRMPALHLPRLPTLAGNACGFTNCVGDSTR